MSEVFPIVVGFLMSYALVDPESGSLRVKSWLISGALVGLISSALSGELSVSWAYWPVDTLLVLCVAMVASSMMASARARALRGQR